jgi:hypothetical protein
LIILLAFLGTLFLMASVWSIWQARHDWRHLVLAVGTLVGTLTIGVGLWRGERRGRWAAVVCLGLFGTFLIVFSAARGRDLLSSDALAVYERVGFHPLVAFYGVGTICLVAAVALARSASIRAYWDSRRGPGPEAMNRTPAVDSPQ